jgi:hypothetical protein
MERGEKEFSPTMFRPIHMRMDPTALLQTLTKGVAKGGTEFGDLMRDRGDEMESNIVATDCFVKQDCGSQSVLLTQMGSDDVRYGGLARFWESTKR